MRSAILTASLLLTPTTAAMCGGGSSTPGSGTELPVDDDGDCTHHEGMDTEAAPIQRAEAGLPVGAAGVQWDSPTDWTRWIAFHGSPGAAATHEGIDWVHDDSTVLEVDVATAAAGEVVYVRIGCPESDLFSRNTALRECGAGWGNHVIIHHGGNTYSRYAHLRDGQVFVEVGDELTEGDVIGVMGNSGRSETRHLHFELGSSVSGFDPCGLAASFDAVHDPALVGL